MARFVLISFLLLLFAPALYAQNEQVETGTLSASENGRVYLVYLQAGQVLMAVTEEVPGVLDPLLELYELQNKSLIQRNFDYGHDTHQAALLYQVPETGYYAVIIQGETQASGQGDYRLHLSSGDASLLEAGRNLARTHFSGPELTRDTAHFRLHYTLEGVDASTEDFVQQVADRLEHVWQLQVEDGAWPAPPADVLDNDPHEDVYLIDLSDQEGHGIAGATDTEMMIGDNPHTAYEEAYAGSTYILVDNDFAEADLTAGVQVADYLDATLAHEFHHAVQIGLDVNDALIWTYEATAQWMEFVAVHNGAMVAATVEDTFATSAICLGASEGGGRSGLDYGDWLFIQALADRFGPAAVRELWADIARYEGWEALDETLARHDANLSDVVARYHIRNLLRDYDFADDIDATVSLDRQIDSPGSWPNLGEGVQELGVNYVQLDAPPGQYDLSLKAGDEALELWSVAIRDGEAQVTRLGREGKISTEAAGDYYLMVLNTIHDDNVDDCSFYSYELELRPAEGAVPEVLYSASAARFIAPELPG